MHAVEDVEAIPREVHTYPYWSPMRKPAERMKQRRLQAQLTPSYWPPRHYSLSMQLRTAFRWPGMLLAGRVAKLRRIGNSLERSSQGRTLTLYWTSTTRAEPRRQ